MHSLLSAYELNVYAVNFSGFNFGGYETLSGSYDPKQPVFIYTGEVSYLTILRTKKGEVIAITTDSAPSFDHGVTEIVSTTMRLSGEAVSTIIAYHEVVRVKQIS